MLKNWPLPGTLAATAANTIHNSSPGQSLALGGRSMRLRSNILEHACHIKGSWAKMYVSFHHIFQL